MVSDSLFLGSQVGCQARMKRSEPRQAGSWHLVLWDTPVAGTQ